MTNYRRYRLKGGCYFFTVVLANRSVGLLTTHINELRTAFRQVMGAHPFTIEAIVILPDHLHCLWTLPSEDDNFSMRWRQIKSHFSRHLPPLEFRSQNNKKRNERGIWQRRFWEHVIRDEADYRRHMDYIHYNPVKHGYVKRVVDWEYSSFHRLVEQGVYSLNWTGEGVHQEMDLE